MVRCFQCMLLINCGSCNYCRLLEKFHDTCIPTLPVIPTTPFISRHQTWILDSSNHFPLIVNSRLTNSGFVARYSNVLNSISGKWMLTTSKSIWALRGPCTSRSDGIRYQTEVRSNQHTRVSFHLAIFLVQVDVVCVEHQSRVSE
jgi:hypothetical protein